MSHFGGNVVNRQQKTTRKQCPLRSLKSGIESKIECGGTRRQGFPGSDEGAEVLRRARDRPNFWQRRRRRQLVEPGQGQTQGESLGVLEADAMDVVLEPEDFDHAHDRGATAVEGCRAHFEGLIGYEDTIRRFEGYQRVAENLRLNNKDPRGVIPFSFVFKGPPGTGKTHTARILGRIFYDMGFLSTGEVIECSATHLIGKFEGHTGPKVVELFERSLGKVLFIDEAYRLGFSGEHSFARHAIGETVDCMTKPRYYRKLVIVLAGYTADMDHLLEVNAGLRGRFATEIHFSPMSPESAQRHLCGLLAKQDIELLGDEAGLDGDARGAMRELLVKLAETKGWSNGRDMQTLAGVVTEHVYGNMDGSGRGLGVRTEDVIRLMGDMLQQRNRGEVEQE
ncbi:hypothetical protein TgHK011_002713 [Trichoderma gracile]|nr:hypothetical protein TgHK011_002713 [Trichoderma gracile]